VTTVHSFVDEPGAATLPWAWYGAFAIDLLFLQLMTPFYFDYYVVGGMAGLAVETVLCASLIGFAYLCVRKTGFYKYWLFWRPKADEGLNWTLLGTVLAVYALLLTFSAASAVLAHHHVVDVSGYGKSGSSSTPCRGSTSRRR